MNIEVANDASSKRVEQVMLSRAIYAKELRIQWVLDPQSGLSGNIGQEDEFVGVETSAPVHASYLSFPWPLSQADALRQGKISNAN